MRKHGEINRGVSRAAVIAALAMPGMLLVPAVSLAEIHTAELSETVTQQARELGDQEMAGMRGRYVERGKVTYFGLSMRTEWQTAGGNHYGVNHGLHIDLADGRPTVSTTSDIHATEGAGDTERAGRGAVIRDGGSQNARGIVQVIQAGGNLNTAGNDLQISIGDYPPAEQAQGNGATRLESQAANIRVLRGSDGIGGMIEIKGHGRAVQQVRPGQGVHQSIQIHSDMQRVTNIADLQLQIGDISDGRMQDRLRNNLRSLRDLN